MALCGLGGGLTALCGLDLNLSVALWGLIDETATALCGLTGLPLALSGLAG